MTKVLVHDWAGHPFQVELSRELARRGYDVQHLHFTDVQGPKGAIQHQARDPANFTVRGMTLPKPYAKYSFARRWFQEQEYARSMRAHIRAWHPDVVISANTPLDVQSAMLRETKAVGGRFVFWLQDCISLAMGSILRNKYAFAGSAIAAYYSWMERKTLLNSDHVVAISNAFLTLLNQWGLDSRRVTLVENWAPKDEIVPGPKNNDWSRRHGIADKRVFLYAGTLGLKHRPQLLSQLAQAASSADDTVVVVASQGPGADWLADQKQSRALSALMLLPFQPYEELSSMLATGDLLLCVIEADAATFSTPSKVLSYMAAGRAQLLSVPETNAAAQLISRVNAGVVVRPGDDESFVRQALQLMNDDLRRAQLADNARRYAEEAFDIARIAGKFLDASGMPQYPCK